MEITKAQFRTQVERKLVEDLIIYLYYRITDAWHQIFWHQIFKGLTNPGLFKPPVDTGRLLSKGLGWLSWKQLRKILEITRGHFGTSASDPFYPCQIPSSYIFSYVPQFH